MTTISLAMIVRDEADRIANVLEAASICCDELIVLDTGSTDATIEIAREYGASVYRLPWCDDFAFARNTSFDWCTSDWILWLDADDHLPVESAQFINSLLGTGIASAAFDAVVAEYRMVNLAGEVTLRFDRERLIRREAGLRWEGRVHETITVSADRTIRSDRIYVEHRPGVSKSSNRDRNLRILESMHEDGDRSPRTLFYLANEYRDTGNRDMARGFYTERLKVDGWIEEKACAAYELGKLWMGVDNDIAEKWLHYAVELAPYRAEPLRQLQHLYKAAADALPMPSGLFVEPWAYR